MVTASARRQVRRSNGPSELRLAGIAILAITLVYLIVTWQLGVPAASGLVGHGIGILGFTLMLMTETLYSLRKRSTRRAWGRMSDWLRFHIFTGIVGPYMVLLHSAWTFNGLAGLLLLLTGLVVASGFFGRYIYTAIPRTADGVIVEASQLQAMIKKAETAVASAGLDTRSPAGASLGGGLAWLLFRGPIRTFSRAVRWLQRLRLDPLERRQAAALDDLRDRLRTLRGQVQALAATRRLLSIWHTLHVPLGLGLFLLAFFHIGAALYYATLLK
jgi:hypothetical protein